MNVETLSESKGNNNNNKWLEVVAPTHMNDPKEFVNVSHEPESTLFSQLTSLVLHRAVSRLFFLSFLKFVIIIFLDLISTVMLEQHVSLKFNYKFFTSGCFDLTVS